MTRKRAVLIALVASLAIVGAAYGVLQLDSPTFLGNLAALMLLPGIAADMGISGNPHSGSGGTTAVLVTLSVSSLVWFAAVYFVLWVYRGCAAAAAEDASH